MTFANTYIYSDRSIFDLKTLLEAIRFIIVNSILAFIFLFLTVEDLNGQYFHLEKKLQIRLLTKRHGISKH